MDKKQVKCVFPWVTPQVITVYSEKTEGYLENVGLLFQQVELYLQTIGLGACWLGMGKPAPGFAVDQDDGLEFVIMLAFGYPDGSGTRSLSDFKRKALFDISDRLDDRLEPARLASSSVNSQPWFSTHEGNIIHVFCKKPGLRNIALADMNRVDMGITLAHLYVANPDTFFF